MGKRKNVNIVEVWADYIYYAIIGIKDEINKVVTTLRTEKVDNYVEYLSLRTSIPLAKHKEKIETIKRTVIKLDPIVEEAHAYAHSCHNSKDSYMLVVLKFIDGNYVLTFPRYVMIDGNDPEKGLINEFVRLSRGKLSNTLRETIRPCEVIGADKDSILYVSILNKHLQKEQQVQQNHIAKLLMFLQALEGGKSDDE
jgi:hypothetical protein